MQDSKNALGQGKQGGVTGFATLLVMATESAGEREGGQPKQAVGSSASGSTSNGVTGGQRLLEKVLSSSATGTDLQNVARVNEEAMAKFVESGSLTLEKYKRAASRVPLPLKFDDNAQEMNFHCLLALLSFGGCHEPTLVKLTGTTVEDSVKFGLIGAHLGRERLDATWMKNAHLGSVSESFKIPAREDAPCTIPGVMVDKPGALVGHVQALCSVLNSTGEALLSRGYSDMAQFVMHSAKSDPGVEGLVKSLVGAMPAFQDTETVQGCEVLMLKNAQVLAGELSARLGSSVEGLRFKDTDKLTAVADADVITALFALGILEPAGGKSSSGVTGDDAKEGEKLDDGQARGGGFPFKASDTADLRAVGVQACHRLADALGDEYRPHELSLYLRRLSRRKEFKDVPRYVPRESRAV